MTEREYLKLNTSIQTASNSDTIKEEKDGTIPAVIELRLPDSLFNTQTGNKKVDTVSMLTTKLRLSLLETPIAQIPINSELTSKYKTTISDCKLDVFPWLIDDNGNLLPTPSTNQTNIAFPSYKKHELTYKFKVCTNPEQDPRQYHELADTYFCISNNLAIQFPKSSRFYELMENNNLIDNHLLNLTIPSTHEVIKIENDMALVKNVSTLEQMWRDGLENAITYASLGSKQVIDVILIDITAITDATTPRPNTQTIVHIDELNKDVCYWKYTISSGSSQTNLEHGCKPIITFDEDTMKFEYDTAAFKNPVPIYWSSSYIDTYENSEQLTLDTYRSERLCIPPPKRVYKYSVNTSGDDETSYDYTFSLIKPNDALPFNIVANKSTRDTFPFLPWIPVPMQIFEKYNLPLNIYKKYDETDTAELGTQETWQKEYNIGFTNTLTLYYDEYDTDKQYTYSAGGYIVDNTLYPIYINYLQDYLNANYPIEDQYSTVVMAVDFYFPENDDGFISTGQIRNTNPGNRRSQQLMMPFASTEGYDNPTNAHDYESQDIVTQTTTETYENNDVYIDPDTIEFTTDESEEKRTLINESSTPIDVTNTTKIYTGNSYWGYYSRNLEIVRGLPISGNWNNAQTFYNNTLDPALYDTVFVHQLATSFKHLPPWAPDDEILSDETRIIGGVKHLRGSLIWIIYSPDRELTAPNRLLTTCGQVDEYEYLKVEGTTTTSNWKVVEKEDDTTYSYHSQLLPNYIDNTDEEIYLLNGASASINIGAQEVIQKNTENYRINTTITTTTQSRTRTDRYISNDTDPTTNEPRITYDEKHMGEIYVTASGTYLRIAYRYNLNRVTSQKSNQTGVWGDLTTIGYTYEPKRELPSTYTEWTAGEPQTMVGTFTSNDPVYAQYLDSPRIYNTYRNSEEITSTSEEAVDEIWYFQAYNKNTQQFEKVATTFISGVGPIPVIDPVEVIVQIDQQNPRMMRVEETWYLLDNEQPNAWRARYPKQYTTVVAETQTTENHDEVVQLVTPEYAANLHLTWVWKNIPTVILSPIQSFVLVLNGMNVSQEIHPINIAQPGSSSLISTIPIIENYYSMANTLRDLHDELVVVKDSYADTTFYKLDTSSGQERTITLSVHYITKDGRLHQLYIPKNGVYSIQLTFGLTYYLS